MQSLTNVKTQAPCSSYGVTEITPTRKEEAAMTNRNISFIVKDQNPLMLRPTDTVQTA